MRRSRFVSLSCAVACIAAALTVAPSSAEASSRSQAVRIYRRIAGVPPKNEQLTKMAALIDSGKVEEAARVAADSEDFINDGAKRFVVGWMNQLGDTQVTMTESVALMLGVIRDDIPFDQVLYGDVLYAGKPSITSTGCTPDPNYGMTCSTPRMLAPAWSIVYHYMPLDNNFLPHPQGMNLLNPTNYDDVYQPNLTQRIMTSKFLVQAPQDKFFQTSYEFHNEVAWELQPPYAGIITLPDFGRAFYSAGTNRRPIKYLMQNFLCKSLDQLMDISLPDVYVRRDVDRSPGGDSRTYKQRCIGCHSGIDAISGAFAHLDNGGGYLLDIRSYGTRAPYPGDAAPEGAPQVYVHDKMNRNFKNYPAGHIVVDTSWVNMWTGPKYADIGWRGATSGTDVKELGQMLARSEAFANCMTERAFKHVCMRDPEPQEEASLHDTARAWESSMHYSMKGLVSKVAAQPGCVSPANAGN